MIINFSNLGGGGGGGYVLPTATETRLGGVKIGEGVAVDSAGTITVTGATNAQQKFIVNSESERDSLTGVSEGDVCTIAPHFNPAIDYNQEFYSNMGYYGSNIIDTLSDFTGTWRQSIRVQKIENPYYESGSGSSQLGAYHLWSIEDGVERYYYGVRCNNEGVWQYLNASTTTDESDWSDLPASGVVMDLTVYSDSFSATYQGGNQVSYLWCEYPEGQRLTDVEYALSINIFVGADTSQYNDGEWIKLASTDSVTSAMTVAQSAVNIASAKLDKTAIWITDWSEVQNTSNCWLEPVVEEGGQWVDKGAYLHLNGWSTEAQHKKVTELVTSPTVMRVLAMTQDEYDALATHDANTLYAIIPDNS